jgi:hypothetical protein
VNRRPWLCLPPALICCVDQALTLLGQPGAYWAGAYEQTLEGSPHGFILLTIHPAAYVIAASGYLIGFCLAILWLPRFLARVLAAGLVIGHCWGASTWLYSFFAPPWGYWSTLGLFGVGAVLLVLGFELSDPREVNDVR